MLAFSLREPLPVSVPERIEPPTVTAPMRPAVLTI
jgi:hypothetical protein